MSLLSDLFSVSTEAGLACSIYVCSIAVVGYIQLVAVDSFEHSALAFAVYLCLFLLGGLMSSGWICSELAAEAFGLVSPIICVHAFC